MNATTVNVDRSVRDRLALLARERGTTMGGLLAEVTERLEREAFFARARHQMERLRDENPSEWERGRTESAEWQRGTDRDSLALQDEPGWWD